MVENELFIASSYLLLGAGIKYIDQAYDIGVFSKHKANFVAILCGILMAYLVVTDSSSAMIFLAMVISLAITRKIDNIAFYIGTALILIIPVIFNGILKMHWFPFGILVLSGITDEIGNDWADKRKNKRLVKIRPTEDNKPMHDFAEKFFTHRFSMKIAITVLVLFSFFEPIYLFAFILFDMMYLLVDMYSMRIKVYSLGRAHGYSGT